MQLLQRVQAAIEILIRGHPSALKILTGELGPPTTEEIAGILGSFGKRNWIEILGCRVDSSSACGPEEQAFFLAEAYLDIIESVGGWKHVNNMTLEYITHNRTYWHIFRDYLLWIDKLKVSRKGMIRQREILSAKYGYSQRQILRIRGHVPRDLAKIIVCFDTASC